MIQNRLIEIQKREGSTDKAFAKKLDICRGSWNRIKNKRSGIGKRTLETALSVYPELIPVYMSNLTRE